MLVDGGTNGAAERSPPGLASSGLPVVFFATYCTYCTSRTHRTYHTHRPDH
jgi:hypothetical protein